MSSLCQADIGGWRQHPCPPQRIAAVIHERERRRVRPRSGNWRMAAEAECRGPFAQLHVAVVPMASPTATATRNSFFLPRNTERLSAAKSSAALSHREFSSGIRRAAGHAHAQQNLQSGDKRLTIADDCLRILSLILVYGRRHLAQREPTPSHREILRRGNRHPAAGVLCTCPVSRNRSDRGHGL